MPLVFEELSKRWATFDEHRHAVLASLMGLLLVAFLFVAPLTFHEPLTQAQYETRMSVIR